MSPPQLPPNGQVPGIRSGRLPSYEGHFYSRREPSPEEREWWVTETEKNKMDLEDRKTIRWFEDFSPRCLCFVGGLFIGGGLTFWIHPLDEISFAQGVLCGLSIAAILCLVKWKWRNMYRFFSHRIVMFLRKKKH